MAKPSRLAPGKQTGISYADLIKLLVAKDKEIMSSMAAIPEETGPISASHVSKADFDKFNPNFIGSGQGHATYGQGHYFATRPEVKDAYTEEFSGEGLYFNGKPVRGPKDMPGLRKFTTGKGPLVEISKSAGRDVDDWHDDIRDAINYSEKHDVSTEAGRKAKQAEIQALYEHYSWFQNAEPLGLETPEQIMEYAKQYFDRHYAQNTELAQWAKAGNLQWIPSVPNIYDVELDVPRDKLWQLDTKLEENPEIFEAVLRAFEEAKVPFHSAQGTGLEATREFNYGTGGKDKKTRQMLSRGLLDAGYPAAGYFDEQSRSKYMDVAKENNPNRRKDIGGIVLTKPVHLDPEQMSATEKLLGLTKNYVMFPGAEKLIKILKKAPSEYTSDDYRILALATAAGAAGVLGAGTAQARDETAFGNPNPDGLIEQGNINLFRPSIPHPDGGSSTVLSTSFEIDGKHVLLPLADEGRFFNDDEAVEKYHRTGQHLGTFQTAEAATAYADQLHKNYESNLYAMPEESAAKPERSYMQYLSELVAGPARPNQGQFFVDFDDNPASGDAPPSPAASSPSRFRFLGNVPNETDRRRGEYQLNRSAAEAHSPLMTTPFPININSGSTIPAEMEAYRRDKYLNKKSSAEHSELMKSAKPAFDELSDLFLSKYDDENGTYRQTLEDNYDDIAGNLLGNEYNSGNRAANAWVSNFFDAMNSEKPRGQNAETPYRDPSEVGSNLADYGDARFAFDKGGLLRKQKLLNQKLEILKTFQEGENAPAFKGVAGKLLANVGGLISSDTEKLADLRSANRPEDAVGEALYWINEGKDLATSPTYRTGGLTGSSPTAEDSFTTLPGVTTQSTDTPTFFGATANAMMARLYHLKKFAQDPFGANLDFAKGTKALNQQAPVVPAHLREQAENSKKRLIDLEQTSHYDPAVEFAATLKAMGIKPFYPSGAVNDALGTIRDLPDAITAGTALFSGGLGFAGGGLRGLLGAASAVGKDFIYDYAQELPLGLAIGHSFQPENKGLRHYLFGQGQGLFDKDGNPVAADSENFDAEYARRNKEHDANYDNVASLGQALGKHEAMQRVPSSVSSWGAAPAQELPATKPVLPTKTPNDIEYDKWNAQQAQTTRGKAYFDHLKTLRR